jgi:VCBS repeat
LVSGSAVTEFTQQDLIDGAVTYDHTADIPPGDVPPNDEFTFDLSDSQGEGPTGKVFSVSVRPANDPPTVANDTDTTQQGTSVSIAAPGLLENDSDPNGDSLSVSAVNGTASNVGQQITLTSGALLTVGADGAYSYDPNGAFDDLGAGDTGSDSFTYAASDGNGGTGQASVSLTIEGLNGAPVATDDSFSAQEDSTLAVDAPGILGNDSDPDGDLAHPHRGVAAGQRDAHAERRRVVRVRPGTRTLTAPIALRTRSPTETGPPTRPPSRLRSMGFAP